MTSSNSIYTLNSGEFGVESDRLHFQHNVFLELTGTICPAAAWKSLPDNPHVADIGTGTGIWLRAASDTLAQHGKEGAILDGFDMDNTKFLDPSSLGKNVSFYVQNVLEPFPQNFLGKYDMVHVRLLMYGLKEGEWAPVLQNLVTLLKPGGWLFWEETGYTSWASVPPSYAMYKLLEKDMQWAQGKGRCLR